MRPHVIRRSMRVDVWSEPHVVNWVWFNTPVEFCYCPHTQARFRDWLKRKYRTLDAVNSAWYRTFSSWDEVEAPRFGTILSYTDLIDWKTFIAAKLEEDLKLKADASAPRGRAPGVQPFRCAGNHAQSALRVRQSGRLVDDAVG